VVRLFDVAGGKSLGDLSCGNRRVRALAFSADGRLLAAGGEARLIRLWDARTLQPAGDLPTRPGGVMTVSFCGESLLAAGDTTNEIRLWNAAERQEAGRLAGHTGTIAALSYDARSGRLLSGSFDTTIRVWQVGE
jgi:WD40 repeat protein